MEYFQVNKDSVTGEETIRPFTEDEIAEHKRLEREVLLYSLRERRNQLLAESDSFTLPDRWNSLSDEKKSEWTVYRQSLRDLPQNTSDLYNPSWPVKPYA